MSPTDTAAFIENAIEATQAAAANGVSVADFNALQQAAHGDHGDATDPSNATSTAQAALGMYPTLHVPPTTEEQFAAQAAENDHHHHDHGFNPDVTQDGMLDHTGHAGQVGANTRFPSTDATHSKPTVGSEEWHKQRKDNHKEGKYSRPVFCKLIRPNMSSVERRRRENINEGINELAKIVPGCEKNKGAILQRAVNFISQLKENEQQNIEKWTLEKLLTEQAITELSQSNDKLKAECERLYRELETWKRVAQNAGLEPPQPKEEPANASG